MEAEVVVSDMDLLLMPMEEVHLHTVLLVVLRHTDLPVMELLLQILTHMIIVVVTVLHLHHTEVKPLQLDLHMVKLLPPKVHLGTVNSLPPVLRTVKLRLVLQVHMHMVKVEVHPPLLLTDGRLNLL